MSDPRAIVDMKPCPFCGTRLRVNDNMEDLYVRRYGVHYMHPTISGVDCPLEDHEVSPGDIESWNRRVAPMIALPLAAAKLIDAFDKPSNYAPLSDAIENVRSALEDRIPNGLVMVPRTPTREMLVSVDDMCEDDKYLARGRAFDIWNRMVAAFEMKAQS